MSVRRRLMLANVPAIVGIAVLAALATWGERGGHMPPLVFVIGIVAIAGSLGLAWTNTRHVGEEIEQAMTRLSGAVSIAEERGQQRAREVQDRTRETEAVVSTAVDRALRELDEVRLPLHILIENQFGDLNDNQEELVAAARDAAQLAAARLRRTQDIIALQPEQLRKEPVRIGDVVASLVAALQSAGGARGVGVVADIEGPLPTLRGDRIRLQESLSLVGMAAVRQVASGATLRIQARGEKDWVVIELHGGAIDLADIDLTWASRVVRAHGGSLTVADDHVVTRLPRN
jgi:hypothetical protein